MTPRSSLLDLSSSGARASMSDVERHPASELGETMKTAGETAVRARAGARTFNPEVNSDVNALKGMSVPELAATFPAIVHYDGTARVQVELAQHSTLQSRRNAAALHRPVNNCDGHGPNAAARGR